MATELAGQSDDRSRSQDLTRGLAVLRAVALSSTDLSAAELSVDTGLNRTVVDRLVRTLAEEGYIDRTSSTTYVPGLELRRLVGVDRTSIAGFAQPLLQRLATDYDGTAVLYFDDGDSLVAVSSAVPAESDVYLTYRIGSRAPRDRGAAGYAIRSLHPCTKQEPEMVLHARRNGWSSSTGEVVPHAHAVAAPIPDSHYTTGCALMFVSYVQETSKAAVDDLIDYVNSISRFMHGVTATG